MLAALSAAPAVAAIFCALLLGLLFWRRTSLFAIITHGRLRHNENAARQPSAAAGLPSDAVEQRVERAAAYVHDALKGRFRGTHWAVRSHSRIRAQRLLRSLRVLRTANLCTYMIVLSFFERPVWCYSSPDCGDPTQVMCADELPTLNVHHQHH